METGAISPGDQARALIRQAARAGLATVLAREGGVWPYVSLVLVATDYEANPLLLLSDLADHTKNLTAEPRVALLFDGTAGWQDPLAGPRVSVLGRAETCDDPRLKARFVARHPGAARYADFADFRLYRIAVQRAHLVAGFGQIHWLDAGELSFDASGAGALAAAEADILAHMNGEHGDAIDLIARRLLGLSGGRWRLVGIDPEGVDLSREGRLSRAAFDKPIHDAAGARAELVRLSKRAREPAPAAPAGESS